MADNYGFIQVARGLSDMPWFGREAFDRYHAFLWMVETAVWKPTKYDVMGRTITLSRGDLCASYRELSTAWKWSIPRVQRFLNRLQTDKVITVGTEHGKNVISLTDYDSYQGPSEPTKRQGELLSDTPPIVERVAVVDAKEEGNNKITPESIVRKQDLDQEFSTFWTAYPEKVAKPKARQSFEKARKKSSLDEIMAGLERYKAAKPFDRSWAHPTTWLNQERWTDGEPAALALPLLGVINGGKPPKPMDELSIRYRVKVDSWIKTGSWNGGRDDEYGTEPGTAGCIVPANILAEFPALKPGRMTG